MKIVSLIVLIVCMAMFSGTAAQGFIHDFMGHGATNGENGYSTPLVSGTTIYGMTIYGGASDQGALWSIGTDGSNFTMIHHFAGSTADNGMWPKGSLVLGGSTLYGMTFRGGANDVGVIFSIGTDGSGFTLLHTFSTDTTNGETPYGDLTLDGSTLYGMTSLGGANDMGTIFSIGTDGSDFTLLRSFSGAPLDGREPKGNLTLSGTTLYGMTYYGGANNEGLVFSMSTDGSGFSVVHSFRSHPTNGENPCDSLVLGGSTLYGMTLYGGANEDGTVFSVGTDGSNFTILHSFQAATTTNGDDPRGNLTLNGSTLYGMTRYGGGSNLGTLFSVGTDGSNYTLIHSFAGATGDGADPWGSLVMSNGTLFGQTNLGGAYNEGILFSNNPTFVDIVDFTAIGRREPASILLQWETATEQDTAGFHVLRSETEDGDYLRVTDSLIPARGGASWGAEYVWLDEDVLPGKSFFYKLEEVEYSSEVALHGPVDAWPGKVDIKVNGLDGPVLVPAGQSVIATVELNLGLVDGPLADHWVLLRMPPGAPAPWYSFVQGAGWQPGFRPYAQMPVNPIFRPLEVMNKSLPEGEYQLYFGVDRPDGMPMGPWIGSDLVRVVVH